jgi:flagellar protein FlaG
MNVTTTSQSSAAAPAQASPGREPTPATQTDGKSLPAGGSTLPPAPATPTAPDIERAVEQIRAFLSESKRELTFERDEDSGKTVIKVIDPASGEVIRQFPPEELLKIAAILESRGFHTFDELA